VNTYKNTLTVRTELPFEKNLIDWDPQNPNTKEKDLFWIFKALQNKI